jgi:hypothetical protein
VLQHHIANDLHLSQGAAPSNFERALPPGDAGLEASSVRRLLTSATANPTTDNAFRLMAAMGIALEAKLPTGERVELVSPGAPATAGESAAAA